jgi:hypothetical protein
MVKWICLSELDTYTILNHEKSPGTKEKEHTDTIIKLSLYSDAIFLGEKIGTFPDFICIPSCENNWTKMYPRRF